MNKYSKLAKNTSVFFIANFGSKILTFLLVRFYTELLSPEEYGIIDLLNTTVSLAFPIVTLCITEAVLRFSIDDISNRDKILTNGLLIMILGNLVFVLSAPFFSCIDTFNKYVVWIYLLTLTNSMYTIVAHFSRGIGKTKLFAASGLIHTILQIGLNLLFLVVFSWGIKGYLISSVMANIITCGVVYISGSLYKFILCAIDRRYLHQMLVYSIPLIPNSIFWWIMQSADRYTITYMLSAADNGLYTVANKIPTLISTISSIFFQAWQISSVEESNSAQKNQFYTKVFEGLSMLLIIAASFIMVILQPLYRILTESNYYIGWTCTPFLLCSMVYSCYSSFLGTNYVAMKKTKGAFVTTVIGAFINVILNIILLPVMGIEGAALATLVSFFITWISRIYGTKSFVTIKYSIITFCIPSVLTFCQAFLLTFGINSMIIQLMIFLVVLCLYLKKIIQYIKYGYKFISNMRGGKVNL
ncbi:MAG: oligosaccharide flippase family protein [Clostridia bacterium]|nr:oligosaccharide flippase family protein [Clostridia bacterium]